MQNPMHTGLKSLTTYDFIPYSEGHQMYREPDRWRLTVKLKSHRALMDFMDFKGFKTSYALASAAQLKPGVVGHLVAKRRNSCSLKTAKAIEGALGCPPGFLFETKMSEVADNIRPKEGAGV